MLENFVNEIKIEGTNLSCSFHIISFFSAFYNEIFEISKRRFIILFFLITTILKSRMLYMRERKQRRAICNILPLPYLASYLVNLNYF